MFAFCSKNTPSSVKNLFSFPSKTHKLNPFHMFIKPTLILNNIQITLEKLIKKLKKHKSKNNKKISQSSSQEGIEESTIKPNMI